MPSAGRASSTASKAARMLATRTLASRRLDGRVAGTAPLDAPRRRGPSPPGRRRSSRGRPPRPCPSCSWTSSAGLADGPLVPEVQERRGPGRRRSRPAPATGRWRASRPTDRTTITTHARGVRQRRQHLAGGVDVVAGVGEQLTGGVRAVVAVGHLLVAAHHLLAQRRLDAGAGDGGRDAADDDAGRLHQADADDRGRCRSTTAARSTSPSSKRGTMTSSVTQPSAHDDATVATAKTAAPATAMLKGLRVQAAPSPRIVRRPVSELLGVVARQVGWPSRIVKATTGAGPAMR